MLMLMCFEITMRKWFALRQIFVLQMTAVRVYMGRKLCYDGGDHVRAGNDGHNSGAGHVGQSQVSSQPAETDIYCNKLQSSPILLQGSEK